MTPSLYLGIDAGNSKTLAVVADSTGRILGCARGGVGDIYAAGGSEPAVRVVAELVDEVLDRAGARRDHLRSAAFRLAGIDWPEDRRLWGDALDEVLAPRTRRTIKNDGFALLRCGSADGVGVAVSLGTGAAIAGRGESGEEFAVSWWFQDYLGAAGLGHDAIRAIMLAEIGLGPATDLHGALTDLYGAQDAESLLHLMTRRGSTFGHLELARASRAVVETAAAGDPVAESIVDEHVRRALDYIGVCARRVGLEVDGAGFTVTLGGSVLTAPASLLRSRLVAAAQVTHPAIRFGTERAVPVIGALLDAIAEGGTVIDSELHHRLLGAELPPNFLST